MTQEQITTLSKIYNTLMLINTKGEDTLIMAECIRALQVTIDEAAKEAGMIQQPSPEEMDNIQEGE